MKNIKLEIKNKWTGNVLFEYESEDNTIKKTLEKAIEKKADLRGADLRGANLVGAYLAGAYLRGADLRGADLRGANLVGAYLRGAYLAGAYLRGAYLAGANLEGADLEGAYLKVSDEEINADEIIKNIENNSNLIIKEYCINRNVIPTRWNRFWKYGLIICDWEIKSEEKEKEDNSNIEHISNEFIQQLKDENVKHIAHKINEIINYLQKKESE